MAKQGIANHIAHKFYQHFGKEAACAYVEAEKDYITIEWTGDPSMQEVQELLAPYAQSFGVYKIKLNQLT